MEQNVVKPRGLLFSFGLAVTVICLATALICGGIILLGNLDANREQSAYKEYYAVGSYCDSLAVAKARAESERLGGRAGYVFSENEGFFLAAALYTNAEDARTVAERLKAETLTVKVARAEFTGEDKALCAEALNDLCAVVEETEKIWRGLDADETSESLTVKMLTSYANALTAYKDLSEGVGELTTRARALLTEAATGGKYPLTADVKYVSAATAALLSAYVETRSGGK